MSEQKESDPDHYNDITHNADEQSEWENEPNLDDVTPHENDACAQKLWLSFQNSATSTAQLYKDGLTKNSAENLWLPFKRAAGSVTMLYNDSIAAKKRAYEKGLLAGSRKRTRELLSWMKKRGRRNIRRDELVSFLLGRTVHTGMRHPDTNTSTHHMRNINVACQSTQRSNSSPTRNEHDLQPFHDALVLQGIDGAMSNVSVKSSRSNSNVCNQADMDTIILDEIGRQIRENKRQARDSDSPNRSKRCRYY